MSEHKPGPSTISVPTKNQRSKQKVYRVRFPLFFDETPASLRLITRDKKFLIFKPQIREREREREMFGKIRVASTSSLDSLELERPTSKIFRDDPLSIYGTLSLSLSLSSRILGLLIGSWNICFTAIYIRSLLVVFKKKSKFRQPRSMFSFD